LDYWKKLSRGDQVVGGAGVLLVINLLFLPWHHVRVGFGPFHVTANRSALESPNAFWGWLALLLAIAMVAHVVLARFTKVELPKLPVTWGRASFIGGVATLAVLLLKLVLKTDFLGVGAWFGVILGAGMAYGGFLHNAEEEQTAVPPEVGTTT